MPYAPSCSGYGFLRIAVALVMAYRRLRRDRVDRNSQRFILPTNVVTLMGNSVAKTDAIPSRGVMRSKFRSAVVL